MDVTFLEDRPCFFVGLHQEESMSEKSNYVVLLESNSPTPTLVTLPDPNSHNTVLPTYKVPWITYYRRNKKEIGSPIAQPAPFLILNHHEIKI